MPSSPSFPADATTMTPAAIARSIAASMIGALTLSPRLMLIAIRALRARRDLVVREHLDRDHRDVGRDPADDDRRQARERVVGRRVVEVAEDRARDVRAVRRARRADPRRLGQLPD